MTGVSGCLKYSLFIFNFFFWLCGILFLGIAIWVRVSPDSNEFINQGDFHTHSQGPANLLIAVGAIIMVLGFLGCCGAIKESRCLLILFFIGLLLILLLQLAAGALGVALKPELESVMNTTLHEQVKILKEKNDSLVGLQKAFAELEEKYECCGLVNGAADWGPNFKTYAKSCECKELLSTLCTNYEGVSVYKKTCASSVKHLIEKSGFIVIGIAFGLVIMEILGMIFSMVLVCQIG